MTEWFWWDSSLISTISQCYFSFAFPVSVLVVLVNIFQFQLTENTAKALTFKGIIKLFNSWKASTNSSLYCHVFAEFRVQMS